VGCSVLPIPIQVKADHFRLENFVEDSGGKTTQVYSMCHLQRPTSFKSARQYEAGQHSVWVTSLVSKNGLPSGTRAAYAHFEADFAAGKNYRIAQTAQNGQVSIWIEEIESGNKVTPIVAAKMKASLPNYHEIRRDRCEQGSV
jgi:hypothetical protein